MLFNSIEFLFFFPIVILLYFGLPYKFRSIMLLVASCIFYMAFIPKYILILFFTILIDFWAAMRIEKTQNYGKRKFYLLASLMANIGILSFFKYYRFLASNLIWFGDLWGISLMIPHLDIILPIGLSFHTFQAMSYTIEVYRNHQKAETNFIMFSLYVMFFPQLVAGPIERPQNLLHQLHKKYDFNYLRVSEGVKWIAWGMFKKVVIADRLAIVVNTVYNKPMEYNGWMLVLATVFFAFQIFCDFSGYSDIAVGTAKVMGIDLINNFNRPYFSKSVAEFWKRWHISLSTWFRDYVYIPLGGNHVSKWRWQFNLFITFLISGLWHGANWTFVIWGALNGFYLIFSIWTQNLRTNIFNAFRLHEFPKLHQVIQIVITFSLICFSWIFFRAQNLNEAIWIIQHLCDGWDQLFHFNAIRAKSNKIDYLLYIDLVIGIGSIVVLEIIHYIQRNGSIHEKLALQPAWVRWAIYYLFVLSFTVLGVHDASQQFIYFQF